MRTTARGTDRAGAVALAVCDVGAAPASGAGGSGMVARSAFSASKGLLKSAGLTLVIC
jgi:hypothetical protein